LIIEYVLQTYVLTEDMLNSVNITQMDIHYSRYIIL